MDGAFPKTYKHQTLYTTMKKQIGITLVIAGIFLMIMQPFQGITGAVIDLSTSVGKTNFFISLILIGIGAVLIYFRKNYIYQKIMKKQYL